MFLGWEPRLPVDIMIGSPLITDFVCEIQDSPKSRKETVHHDRIKPYYGEFQS